MAYKDGFVIVYVNPTGKKKKKKTSCRNCLHYDPTDHACSKMPFQMREDGYQHWKDCQHFKKVEHRPQSKKTNDNLTPEKPVSENHIPKRSPYTVSVYTGECPSKTVRSGKIRISSERDKFGYADIPALLDDSSRTVYIDGATTTLQDILGVMAVLTPDEKSQTASH